MDQVALMIVLRYAPALVAILVLDVIHLVIRNAQIIVQLLVLWVVLKLVLVVLDATIHVKVLAWDVRVAAAKLVNQDVKTAAEILAVVSVKDIAKNLALDVIITVLDLVK